MGKDLLSIADLGLTEVEALASRAIDLAHHWHERSMPQTLARARIGVIEELPGWRNPTALHLGATVMGATCVRVSARLEGAETVGDLASYMDNWFDLLGVRTPSLTRLRSFADALTAPVVNLRTNDDHPCEILGDLSFILQERRTWDGLRVVMVGPKGNIARSWFEAAGVLPIEVTQVAPDGFGYACEELPERAATTDDINIIEDADLIVTDCWPLNLTDEERAGFAVHRIDAALLDRCRTEALFVPCPPVNRGQEVSDDAMTHPQCQAAPAKAFLLHAQNAVMERGMRY
jgi:ornithine carbamoyltransferase